MPFYAYTMVRWYLLYSLIKKYLLFIDYERSKLRYCQWAIIYEKLIQFWWSLEGSFRIRYLNFGFESKQFPTQSFFKTSSDRSKSRKCIKLQFATFHLNSKHQIPELDADVENYKLLFTKSCALTKKCQHKRHENKRYFIFH